MFSTSEKTALGGLRRAASKEVELRSTNGQECPFPHFAVAQKTARNSMGPSAWLENISNRA
jgi:hypothetical protein